MKTIPDYGVRGLNLISGVNRLKSISEFGIPFSVRSDHGGENIEIWKFMLCIHKNSSCVITGASVHNERVERLWRDVTR